MMARRLSGSYKLPQMVPGLFGAVLFNLSATQYEVTP